MPRGSRGGAGGENIAAGMAEPDHHRSAPHRCHEPAPDITNLRHDRATSLPQLDRSGRIRHDRNLWEQVGALSAASTCSRSLRESASMRWRSSMASMLS